MAADESAVAVLAELASRTLASAEHTGFLKDATQRARVEQALGRPIHQDEPADSVIERLLAKLTSHTGQRVSSPAMLDDLRRQLAGKDTLIVRRHRQWLAASVIGAAAILGIGFGGHKYAQRNIEQTLASVKDQLSASTLAEQTARTNQLTAESELKILKSSSARSDERTAAAAVRQKALADLERSLAARRATLDNQQKTLDVSLNEYGRRQKELAAQTETLKAQQRRLDTDRQALDRRMAQAPPSVRGSQPNQAATSGSAASSLIWQGLIKGKMTISITGGKANWGQVSGALPGRACQLEVHTFGGKFSFTTKPSSSNKWNQAVFTVDGDGMVTVFFVWVT